MIRTVGIVGFGALGVMYATEFQKVLGKNQVIVIANQQRIDRYQTQGVLVNGEQGSFCFVTPDQAVPVDLLILAVKFQDLSSGIDNARGAVDDHTIVMSFLNGVVSEQRIAEQLQPRHLLYTTVQGMDTTRIGREVHYSRVGSAAFGEQDGSCSEAVLAVEEFLKQTTVKPQISQDISRQLWSKWMLNVGVNQSCAVYDTNYGGVCVEGKPRQAMILAMEEARQVAGAEGIHLTEEERDAWVALMATLAPEGEPSMKQDVRAGRLTEVELFAALVCRLGEKHHIPVPQNTYFYEKLTAWNHNVAEGKG